MFTPLRVKKMPKVVLGKQRRAQQRRVVGPQSTNNMEISSPFQTNDEGNIIQSLRLVSNEAGCEEKEIEVDNTKENASRSSVNDANGDNKTQTEKTVALATVSEIAPVEQRRGKPRKRVFKVSII